MNEQGHQKAADHRARANKYRQTPLPEHQHPAAEKVSDAPVDTSYPKAVTCVDGAVRLADDEEHEESLMSQKMVEDAPEPVVVPDPNPPVITPEAIAAQEAADKEVADKQAAADLEELKRMASAGEPLIRIPAGVHEISEPIIVPEGTTVQGEPTPEIQTGEQENG